MKKIKINPRVIDDLLSIKNYIARESIKQAELVIKAIIKDIYSLREFPEIGNKLSNKIRIDSKYRYLKTYSYATVFYLDGDLVMDI